MQINAELNDKQREAVLYRGGPLLILAGAGSGKTRTLTYRIAQLISEGVRPDRILAITFTNKAAAEMKERISRLVPFGHLSIWMGTFHGICLRILRREADKLEYNSNFVIYDTADQETVVKSCMRELNIDAKKISPKAVVSAISRAKNELMDADDLAANSDRHDFFAQRSAQIYQLYQQKLRDNNAMDFGDLIMNTVILFKLFPQVLDYYQSKFEHILVDEYQDTNHAQYVLVKLLAAKHRNLCVVGDDDQSIYRWRGADLQNILDFEEDYPDAKVIRLEQNYRSTQVILDAANAVIANNAFRKPKRLWTDKQGGELIGYYQAYDERDEADFVAKSIEALEMHEYDFSDMAVLYRTHAQSRVIEEALMRHAIPYQIIGGLKFYERREIKDILAYLRLLVNPDDDVSLMRIINVPKRGIGIRTVEKLQNYAEREDISLYQALEQAHLIPGVGSRTLKNLHGFYQLIGTLRQMASFLAISEVILEVAEKTGYLKELRGQQTIEAETRIENIKELQSVAKDFANRNPDASLEDFMAEISLQTEVDAMTDSEQSRVVLMTLHSAKGLEFPVVYLVGLEEGVFPHSRSLFDEEELEEERRLCYVGMTRAKERLYLVHATMRTLYGETRYNSPSRFLEEVPEELLEYCDQTSERLKSLCVPRTASRPRHKCLSNSKNSAYLVGDKVEHKTFGRGTVVSVEEDLITVVFESAGVKRLLSELAPLSKIE